MRAPAPLLVLALVGCPSVGRDEWSSVRDRDGDGEPAVRFGGRDCVDDDPAVAVCDADGDGFVTVRAGGDDCDDDDPDVSPDTRWYPDGDADGVGASEGAVASCRPVPGHVRADGDCDDADPDAHPGATETCDDRDLDCSGDPYDAPDPPPYYVDADGDGWGVLPAAGNACVPPPGHAPEADDGAWDCDDDAPGAHPGGVEVWYDGVDGDCAGGDDDDQDGDGHRAAHRGGDDCADLDASAFPGASEACDGVDDDCDGQVDQGVFPAQTAGAAPYAPDADGDGFGDPAGATTWRCLGAAHPGWSLTADDCDDARASVSPIAREVCDNVDQDCDGAVDDGATDAITVYVDADGDGWGGAERLACGEAPGLVGADRQGDCDDADPASHPGAPEVCGDGVRQDCRTDVTADDCDADGVEAPADCLDDPADPRATAVRPGATEVCDGVDNDCDGLLDDEELTNPVTWPDWYLDVDGDGFGSPVLVVTQTCSPPPFAAPNADDCDDARSGVFPGAVETCDGRDEDCDGVDDDVDPADATAWWSDRDGDGFGAGAPTRACDAPGPRFVAVSGDCDDGDAATSPVAAEVCNAVDDDCDGAVDAADPSSTERVWRDDDGDGAGAPDRSMAWCGLPPAGFAAAPDDCDDLDGAVGPAAVEVCNGGTDDDCDGLADAVDPDLDPASTTRLSRDADGDGFGDAASPAVDTCAGTPGWVADATDCDDTDRTIAPDQPESCLPGDDDCDGRDETDPAEVVEAGLAFGFADGDGDGWGDVTRLGSTCGDVVAQAGDCDDGDGDVHPGALEVCDGADDDCNGLVDDADPLADPLLTGAGTYGVDLDQDGFTDPGQGVRRACRPAASEIAWDGLRADDCDDLDPLRSPAVPEVCDGVDNDCDASVDEGAPDADLLYEDGDGDGVGGVLSSHCGGPGPGWVTVGGDCDDADGFVTTGATWCADVDTDGWGDPAQCAPACSQPVGTVDAALAADCDDADGAVSPDGDEGAACDGVDQDCDGTPDDGLGVAGYADVDGDTFGDAAAPLFACPGPGLVLDATDCDDARANVFPGAPEICDGLDDDCDLIVDEGLVCSNVLWWPDVDGDGYGDPTATPSTTGAGGWVDNPLDCDDGVSGDVVPVGPYTTYATFKSAWNTANTQHAPCVLFEIGADLTIADYLTVAAGEARRLRAVPGLDLTLTQGGMMGSGSLQSAGGDLVVHDLDLAPPTSFGAFQPLLGVVSTSFGTLTVSVADVNLSGKTMNGPLIAGDATGTLRTAALTVHDSASTTAAIRQAGTAVHDLLTLERLAVGIEEAGSTSVLRAPVFRDTAAVFGQPSVGFGSALSTLQDAVVERSVVTLTTYGSGTWTLDGCTLTDSTVQTAMMTTGMATVTVTDSTFDGGGGLVIDGYGVDATIQRSVFDHVTGNAIDLGSFYDASLLVEDTTIVAPTGAGVLLDAQSVSPYPSAKLVQNVVVAGAGTYGLVGSGWTLDHVTVVGAGLAGVGKTGVLVNPVVRDAIVVDSGSVDLGPSVTLDHVLYGSKSGGGPASVGTAPGFLRYEPAADPGAWDLRLHPVGTCSDADTTSTTGGPVGALPVASATSGDGDTLADAWELAWFGDLVTADDASDTNGDGETDAAELSTCQDPVP